MILNKSLIESRHGWGAGGDRRTEGLRERRWEEGGAQNGVFICCLVLICKDHHSPVHRGGKPDGCLHVCFGSVCSSSGTHIRSCSFNLSELKNWSNILGDMLTFTS